MITHIDTMSKEIFMACRIYANSIPVLKVPGHFRLFIAIISFMLVFSGTALPQVASYSSVCYGEPIYLHCTLPGCELSAATFHWLNKSGSWTSDVQDPVIFPGAPGYATDIFTLTLHLPQPVGGVTMKSYNVVVRDSISIEGTQSNVQCNGTAEGAIKIAVTGAGSPYVYSWSNGSASGNLTGLTAGIYTVTVTDFYDCSKIASFIITGPEFPLTINTAGVLNADCNGGNQGAIDIDVTGGAAPYQYLWSTGQITEDISSVIAGTYTVTVTDANNCSQSGSWTVEAVCDPVCYGQPIYLFCTLSGCAMPGATYLWRNSSGSWTSGEADPVIYPGTNGYASDVFSLYLEYAPPEGSFSTGSYLVTLRDPLDIDMITSDVLCQGGADGTVAVTASGGAEPYNFQWSNGSGLPDLTGLSAGTYSLTVSDANGCSGFASCTIHEPASPVTVDDAGITNADCNGGNGGAIDVTVSGGTPPYSFLWSTGDTSEDVTSLVAGTYTVTVTDANNCSLTGDWIVDAVCAHVCYGEPVYLFCTLPGCPSPGATFLWTNSSGSWTSDEPDPVIMPGTPGYASDVFSLTLFYAPPEGSTSVGSYKVTINDPIEISGTQNNVPVYGGSGGTIELTVTGGEPPYTFNWSNGSCVCRQTGLTCGTYTVTVTDAINCTNVATFTITGLQSPVVISNVLVTHADCSGSSDGAIDIQVTGGTAPYGFLWNTGDITEDISSLVVGEYSVTVSDQNNFIRTGSWMVPGICDPVCDGQPIYLFCTLPGCPAPGATFFWSNSSGSWTSTESDPVIYPGTQGYATDIFSLFLLYAPPEGSFSHGSYYITLEDCQKNNDLQSPQSINDPSEPASAPGGNASLGSSGSGPSHDPSCRVYPNPTTGLITLDFAGMNDPGGVQTEVYSLLGEKIMSQKLGSEQGHTLSLAGRPNGNYLLRLYSKEKVVTVKILKQ